MTNLSVIIEIELHEDWTRYETSVLERKIEAAIQSLLAAGERVTHIESAEGSLRDAFGLGA